jgi:hypothetical protein
MALCKNESSIQGLLPQAQTANHQPQQFADF